MRKPRNLKLEHLALGSAFLLILAQTALGGTTSTTTSVNLSTSNGGTGVGLTVINQTIALKGNPAAGDFGGFPVTITQPGSYILASNLDLRQLSNPKDQTAIQVAVDNVRIDLNGFSIIGITSCAGTPPTCNLRGTGRGISSTNRGITLVNGTVRGMGGDGINVGDGALIENVQATSNGLDGIHVGNASTVRGSKAQSNADDGIMAGDAATLTGNTAQGNGDDGIEAGQGSTVTGNTANADADDGIVAKGQCTVTGNTSTKNLGDGIVANSGSVVKDNSASGQTAHFGLNLGPAAAYAGNVLTDNNGPAGNNNPQVSGGVPIGGNLCGTDAVCP